MSGLIPRDEWQHRIGDLFRGLFASFQSVDGTAPISLPGIGDCIPARSGRSALVVAIKALDLPPGARIGVPLYCCSVVFRAIRLAGCNPEFLDVDRATFCISPRDLESKRSHLDAVIAVHMFGNVCDVPRLKAVAPDLPFIEDCALSLGSRIGENASGTFGEVSIFSFRSGKYLSAGEGGALFSRNPSIRETALRLTAGLPRPTPIQEWLHTLKSYAKSLLRSRPLYGIVGHRLWEGLNRKLNLSAKSDVALGQIYRADLAIAKRRLPSLESTIRAHRENAEYYSRELGLAPEMLCREPSGFFYNRLQYPVIFPTRECRDAVAAYLFEEGIDTIKYLDEIVELATKTFGYAGGCPVGEELSKTVLMIPNYSALRPRDVKCIAACLNSKWPEISRDRDRENGDNRFDETINTSVPNHGAIANYRRA